MYFHAVVKDINRHGAAAKCHIRRMERAVHVHLSQPCQCRCGSLRASELIWDVIEQNMEAENPVLAPGMDEGLDIPQ
ncbi:hypothetical protein VTN96DRAFT_8384 [Rasamsonia emersonii]